MFCSKGVREWRNPIIEFLETRYRVAVKSAIEHRLVTIGARGALACSSPIYLTVGGLIGSNSSSSR